MTKNKALDALVTWIAPPAHDSPTRNAYDQVTTFYNGHGQQLVWHLTAVYGNHADAAEVAQETLYRMYDLLLAGHRIERPPVWAYRVARNLMLDRIKQQRNDIKKVKRFARASPPVDSVTGESLLVAHELSQERQALVRAAFAKLTEVERQCVVGRGQGLKLSEIAQIVGLSLKHVSDIICRALAKMQRSIGE